MSSADVETARIVTESSGSKRKRHSSDSENEKQLAPPAADSKRPSSSAAAPSATSASASSTSSSTSASSSKSSSTTVGVYIPPAKLREMRARVQDKNSDEYQRLTWEALKKSINGLVNKVNVSNIKNILMELFAENLIRGRGLLCRSVMKAQSQSPMFTHVFAALMAVVNSKMPAVGELLLKRLITQFKKSFRRNDKLQCVACVRFLAHLVNQRMAGELLALELLTLLLDRPTDDSVEVAIGFTQECGRLLTDTVPKELNDVFETFRAVLHEGSIDKRVQFMIEDLMAARKARFEKYPTRLPELELVDDNEQITHELSLEESYDVDESANVYRRSETFAADEEAYEQIKRELLGDEQAEDGADADADENAGEGGTKKAKKTATASEEPDGAVEHLDEQNDDDDGEPYVPPDATKAEASSANVIVHDQTDTDRVALRRAIYLTIMSSLDFEECAHKLLKVKFPDGSESELVHMIVECCSQERTYLRFYGLLAARFCLLTPAFAAAFHRAFAENYATIHRLETNKIRNVAKLFAHLLHTDSLSWTVLECVRLTEDETTSSSRIFLKILFQELSEFLGVGKLNARLRDASLQPSVAGVMITDSPKNTRFAINFFTSIGLGALTDELREHLKTATRLLAQQKAAAAAAAANKRPTDASDSDSDSDSSSSSSDSDSSSSSSSSSSSDSSSAGRRRRKGK